MCVRAKQDGVLDAVMMTWDLALHGDVMYSTRYVPCHVGRGGCGGGGASKGDIS